MAGEDLGKKVDFRIKRGQITWIESSEDPRMVLMLNGCFRHISDEELDRQITELEDYLGQQ